jgi:hypothetical protein
VALDPANDIGFPGRCLERPSSCFPMCHRLSLRKRRRSRSFIRRMWNTRIRLAAWSVEDPRAAPRERSKRPSCLPLPLTSTRRSRLELIRISEAAPCGLPSRGVTLSAAPARRPSR